MSEIKEYTTKIKVENYLLTTIKTYFVPQVEEWIKETERFIDEVTGRNFKADEVATYRKFEVGKNYARSVSIDECVEIEEVKYKGEVIEEEDYYIYPSNEETKNKITLCENKYFHAGNQDIEVKARWGYSEEVPDDIRIAATAIVAGLITFGGKKDIPAGIEKETIGPYSLVFANSKGWADSEKVDNIISRYSRVTA